MFNSRQLIILITASLALAQDFDWDCTRSLGTCNNACYAVNCKHAAHILNYDMNAANRGPRRTASGCNRTPCTHTHYSAYGNSCDEYPFASTQQGGAGAILRCVDSSENSSEGGQLGAFYRGIPDGHQFAIYVRNYGGGYYCEHAQSCNNDGGEFTLANGNFANARRTDDENLSFESADSDSSVKTTTASAFRKFMGSDGIERLWLTKDTTRSPVGDYVWNGEGDKVQIVSEIIS